MTKFWLSFYYNSDNSYLFVNRKEISKLQASNKDVNFPSQFCLGSISNKFDSTNSEEASLKGNLHDFSVDYGPIGKHSQAFNV